MKMQKAQCVLTKFFYADNHLHYQILIQTESDLFNYGEYSDYGLYRKDFDQVQQDLNKGTKIVKRLEKKLNLETAFA